MHRDSAAWGLVSGVVLVVLAAGSPVVAGTRAIHYGAVTDPAVVACDRMHWRGQLERSLACYAALRDTDAALAVRAEAAWAMGDREQANRWFQQALLVAPDDVDTRVRWGDLYAATHQGSEAMKLYREALAVAPDHAFARLGAARLLVGSFDQAAGTYIHGLLDDEAVADSARAAAWILLAWVALERGDHAEARAALEEADTLLGPDWPPLELYALRAAADLLDESEPGPWTERALEYNPRFGEIFATPAHFYVMTRRYRAAIELFRQAVAVEPGLASAHEALGVNLLRDDRMTAARKHLELAHRADPFSPVAVNTLRLLDSLDQFEVIEAPLPNGAGVGLRLRLHRDEVGAIAPDAVDLVRASSAAFTIRYGFTLTEPVVVEMYPEHEDFAVRTAGMPGLGILGATFGYVIAMDSPSAQPAEHFQWGTTLWHEMAHVFTLEATAHRVPRWFSEGISVWEEWRSGPNPGVKVPLAVYAAIRAGRFLPIAALDNGFIRPGYPDQVLVSYIQAGLVCQFIEQDYGVEGLRGLLAAFADGRDSVSAIDTVLKVSPGTLDERFAAFIEQEHGATLSRLDDWQSTRDLIAKRTDAGAWGEVVALAGRLIDIVPGQVGADSPYLARAMAEQALGQPDAAAATLEQYWRRGGHDPASLATLAAAMEAAGRQTEAIEVLRSVNLVDPLDRGVRTRLGDLLLADGRPAEALREYEAALALQPLDVAAARFRVAQAHFRLGNLDVSRTELLQALDVAPNYRPAQRLLLELVKNQPTATH